LGGAGSASPELEHHIRHTRLAYTTTPNPVERFDEEMIVGVNGAQIDFATKYAKASAA
jgi:hypothetical protein